MALGSTVLLSGPTVFDAISMKTFQNRQLEAFQLKGLKWMFPVRERRGVEAPVPGAVRCKAAFYSRESPRKAAALPLLCAPAWWQHRGSRGRREPAGSPSSALPAATAASTARPLPQQLCPSSSRAARICTRTEHSLDNKRNANWGAEWCAESMRGVKKGWFSPL